MAHKKMKILLAVSNDLVSDNRVHKVASTLVDNGFDVCVYGRLLPHSLPMPQLPYRTKRMKLFFTKKSLFYAELNIRLFLSFLFSKADIFTANDLDTLLGVYCAARIRRKKIVYDSHEYFTEVPELVHNPKAKAFWLRIEQAIFPKLSKCMTVCASIATIYTQKYGVPVKVVRNVPFYLHLQPTPKHIEGVSKKIILYQGAVNLGRGLELMIDAMPNIETAQLVIIGGGDKLQELKDYVEKKHLQQCVIFLGRIHFSELPEYTVNATIGISLEEDLGENYFYALPNKIFDYIQVNKPIIVSDLPEMRCVVETYLCGEIVKERTPEALAQQINALLSNDSLMQLYSENSKKAAKELCWEKEKQTLLNLYGCNE